MPGGKPSQVAISTAEAEAAEGLCTWTVATLCRALTLPNILTLLTGAQQLLSGDAYLHVPVASSNMLTMTETEHQPSAVPSSQLCCWSGRRWCSAPTSVC